LLGRKKDIEAVPAEATTAPGPAGGTCCGPGIPVTQVRIGGAPVGLVALEPIFEQLYEQGRRDGAGLDEELLTTIKLYNYVPDAAEELYKAALLEEYQKFCRGKGK